MHFVKRMNNEKINITEHQRKRPIFITILALWLIFNVFTSVAGMVTPTRSLIYPDGIVSLWGALGLAYILLMLTAAVGYWRMEPWGVYSFAVYAILGLIQQSFFDLPPKLNQAMNQISGASGITTALTILYSAIVLIPGYIYIIRSKKAERK